MIITVFTFGKTFNKKSPKITRAEKHLLLSEKKITEREQCSDYHLSLTQDSQSESGGSVNFIEKTDPSHLQYNDQWKYDSRNLNGLYNYINQLTLGANTLLGKVLEDNF